MLDSTDLKDFHEAGEFYDKYSKHVFNKYGNLHLTFVLVA